MRFLLPFLLFTFAIGQLFAQKQGCVLTGSLGITHGPSYPYRLELDISGSNGKGISVTEQDGSSIRTKVTAYVKKEQNMLVVTETVALGSLPDSMEVCYINAILRWKIKKGNVQFSGVFAGKNKAGKMCSEGKMELSAPLASCTFLTPPAPPVPRKDTVTTDTALQAGFRRITEGADMHIVWKSRVCTLEVWDGGVIDGDAITILHNKKEVATGYPLTAEKKQFILPLADGTNTITIVAGNDGSAPPNTAQILLYDGDEQYRLAAFNKKGKSASIILSR